MGSAAKANGTPIGFEDLQKADAKRPATRIPPGKAISGETRKLVVKEDIQK
jgi:hypothetical protein